MAGLEMHGSHPKEIEDEKLVAYNTKIGLWLFLAYLIFYLGFMVLSSFFPSSMSMIVIGGLNLAVTYGFALILAAIVIALLYMKLCRKPKEETQK